MSTPPINPEEYGGIECAGALMIPAEHLAAYLEAVREEAAYFECLFISDRGTRPSLMLSAQREEFATPSEFVEFGRKAAAEALAQASDGERAYFEVGEWTFAPPPSQ